jgi:hypothetical protein
VRLEAGAEERAARDEVHQLEDAEAHGNAREREVAQRRLQWRRRG